MSNEMYFDPASFDFTNLVDVVETTAEKPQTYTKAEEVNQDGGVIDDASDLADLFMSDEDEPETEPDFNDDASDLTPSDEVDPDKITLFNDLPDDAVLTFAGREMPKAKVNEYLSKIDEYENNKELVGTAANSVDQIHRFITQNHKAHALSIDTNIANIQRKMNSGISNAEYGEEARKLQQAYEAKAMLNARVDEEMRLLDMERAEVARFRINQVDQELRAEVPQWDQIKGGLLKDMNERGHNLAELEKIWSKSLAMDLLDAYRFRKQKEKAGAAALEAAKAKAPRSTTTAANAQRQKSLDANAAKKQALLNKAKKGQLSREEHSQMFNYLVD